MKLRCLVLALALFAAACGGRVDNAQHAAPMQALLDSTPSWVESGAIGKRLWAIERAFYEGRKFEPAWIDGDATTEPWKDLVSQLHYSARHGLDPARYRVAEFEQAREQSQDKLKGTKFPAEQVPELDAKMTYAYLRYAADLLGWDENPKAIYRNWIVPAKDEDLAARLSGAIAGNSVRASIEELAPTHQQYKGLQAALAAEQQAPTGNADKIKINLERWRWASRDLGDRYVLVNVPAYQMQVMEGDTPVVAMRVIVGSPQNPTPLFSDRMQYVVFSPYWNIPSDILKNETLPRVAKDPAYLARNNMEVVGTSGDVVDASGIDWSDQDAVKGLRFRQTPGPENALGLVKFLFPNNFAVYLHDTPTDKLFFQETRALSHGCIRVENPVGLARYVMRERPEWTDDRIERAMHAQQEQHVKLKETIPVHIGYWTAWVGEDGKTVTYTQDPYGLDAKQLALMKKS